MISFHLGIELRSANRTWCFRCAVEQLGLWCMSSPVVGVNGDLPVFVMSLHNLFFHPSESEGGDVNYQEVVSFQVPHALDYRIL